MTTVETSVGTVRGTRSGGVIAFKGIPYAASPEGGRRFRPPQPVAPWDGVRDATQYGPVPFQQQMPGVFGELATPVQTRSFDSLLLNVWTPDPGAGGLPVLVWIHGGAFYAGSGSDEIYDGSAFARDGVVTVTVNYRLGIEGFLHLDELMPGLESSGCNGLADQVAALRWVQENIAAFGGDPGNVTIAGESAGGQSVVTLMATPSARGLFHRVIAQSPSGHSGISAATATRIARRFLDEARIAPGDLASLQSAPPEQLLTAQEALTSELQATRDLEVYGEAAATAMAFQPTHDTPFLPKRPLDALRAGHARDIALVVGTNNEETLLFIKALSDIFNEGLVRQTLQAVMTPAGRDGDTAFERYQRARSGAKPYEIAAAAETDRLFRIPAIRIAEAQSVHQPDVYMYRFDWRSRAFDGDMGAFHFLEIAFTFDNLHTEMGRSFTGSAPQQLADTVHSAWVSFIKTGRPSSVGELEWPPYDIDRRPTMVFADSCKSQDDPAQEERLLWEGVI
jgi:para-nitrobenzyl esterase